MVSGLLTGVVVGVSGAIGFVGLMVPHLCRLLIGGDHRWLLPLSALTGALLLVVVDLVCRTAMDSQELPVGVVTAMIGAPVLLTPTTLDVMVSPPSRLAPGDRLTFTLHFRDSPPRTVEARAVRPGR